MSRVTSGRARATAAMIRESETSDSGRKVRMGELAGSERFSVAAFR